MTGMSLASEVAYTRHVAAPARRAGLAESVYLARKAERDAVAEALGYELGEAAA